VREASSSNFELLKSSQHLFEDRGKQRKRMLGGLVAGPFEFTQNSSQLFGKHMEFPWVSVTYALFLH
jgi:hypothetical protein